MPNFYSTESFEKEYTYTGDDLGATWTAERTAFRVWAPTASAVAVNLYKSGDPARDDRMGRLPMARDVNGTWTAEAAGDLNGVYYTYEATVDGTTHEACDPYARTTGVNGRRAMVIDLAATDPEGWAEDADPHAGAAITDAVIYELHVRDLSSQPSSGIEHAGKFLGLTEMGTRTPGGAATGIDHIKELGVTHVQLLPVYDFGSVDERGPAWQYNWGYDPVNYNVPEGSYATDPWNGAVRVAEMKRMVRAMHQNGLSVVMDVVYNHVQSAEDFCFNRIVPGYFSRIDGNGAYSNGSGCGNDTASERSMVRKYIVDSVNYWADQYHMDGFRFDLAGLLDADTVNAVVTTVRQKHPNVIFYGEGWSMATAPTKAGVALATQANAQKTPGFAYFNDSLRDALRGGVFDKGPGYVSGAPGRAGDVARSFLGRAPWCPSPAQAVNYASCHDNNTLFDRLALSVPSAGRGDVIRMNKLAAAICMTAQGTPFLQAGEEMLRTKLNPDGTFNDNSYNAGDGVNGLRWDTLDRPEYAAVFGYYKGLIAFRKAHPVLRLTDPADVSAHVRPVEGLPADVLAFQLTGGVNGERAQALYIAFNPHDSPRRIPLPEGDWDVCVNDRAAGTEALDTVSGAVEIAPISALALVKRG